MIWWDVRLSRIQHRSSVVAGPDLNDDGYFAEPVNTTFGANAALPHDRFTRTFWRYGLVAANTIHLAGLSRADAIELTEYIDREHVTLADEGLAEGDFGDLGAVTAVVVLSAVTLRGLVAYLAYRCRGKSFKQTVEVQRADGTRIRSTVTFRDTSGEPIDTSIARELGTLSGIPLEQIVDHAE